MAEFKKKTMEKFRSFRHHPGSFLLWLITMLAAVCTICVLGFLVIYILIKGVPHLTPSLFAWTYDSNNVSMMPSIINTILMTGLTLLIAAPLGIFAAVYLVEYAKKGNNMRRDRPCDGGDTDRNPVHRIWIVWYAVFRWSLQMGIFASVWSIYAGDHGLAGDHAYDRGGAARGAGFIPGGKLRTWSRKTAYGV